MKKTLTVVAFFVIGISSFFVGSLWQTSKNDFQSEKIIPDEFELTQKYFGIPSCGEIDIQDRSLHHQVVGNDHLFWRLKGATSIERAIVTYNFEVIYFDSVLSC